MSVRATALEACLMRVLYIYQSQERLRLHVLFSVGWLPLTETYSCNNEIRVWKRPILFSTYSMTKTDFAAKILGTGKKPSHLANCYITFPLNSSILSKQVFKSVCDFSALKKSWNLTLLVQCSPLHPDKVQIPHLTEGHTRQIAHSPGTETSKMPKVFPS